jgi:hypothetical protein
MREGGEESQVAPYSVSPSPKDMDLVRVLVPHFLPPPIGGVLISLSLSSLDRVAPLEARVTADPGASTEKSAPRLSAWISPRPCTISCAK